MPVLSGLDLSGLPVFFKVHSHFFSPFAASLRLSLPGLLPSFPASFFLQGLGSGIRDGELLIIPDFACKAFRIRACSCSLLFLYNADCWKSGGPGFARRCNT